MNSQIYRPNAWNQTDTEHADTLWSYLACPIDARRSRSVTTTINLSILTT